ncbi:MAG: hypothetical protein HFG38_05745 [Eubacterium sp.]|nr:hypothetical protein [Eubacterium sp.]
MEDNKNNSLLGENRKLYQEELQKPLKEIKEDIFFRTDNFEFEEWYEDILLFTRIGTCQPKPEHMETVQKALKILGFCTHVVNRNGRDYLAPGERQIKKQRNKEDERLR